MQCILFYNLSTVLKNNINYTNFYFLNIKTQDLILKKCYLNLIIFTYEIWKKIKSFKKSSVKYMKYSSVLDSFKKSKNVYIK